MHHGIHTHHGHRFPMGPGYPYTICMWAGIRAFFSYEYRCLKRALSDTVASIKSIFGHPVHNAIKFIGVMVFLWWLGKTDYIEGKVTLGMAAVATMAGLFLLVFVINLFTTPSHIDIEQRREIRDQRRKLTEKTGQKARLQSLKDSFELGRKLQKKRFEKSSERRKSIIAWMENTEKILEDNAPDVEIWTFQTVCDKPSQRGFFAHSRVDDKELLERRVDTLREIIGRLSK